MKEVICIKSHSKNVVVKDNIYNVYSILQTSCKCGPKTLYDVGIRTERGPNRCPICNISSSSSEIYWISSILFADLADISELTEILSKEVAI